MSPRSGLFTPSEPLLPLLCGEDPPPLELHNPNGQAPVLLVCDHASRLVPGGLGGLGLAPSAFDLHIAYDIGAAEVALLLSKRLDAALLSAGYSRLVIDLNRGLDQPTLIPEASDGIIISGNLGLSHAARGARIEALYHPWHRAVTTELRRLDTRTKVRGALIGVHSFTPRLNGSARPWQVGVLWDGDCKLARPLMAALAGEGLSVGDNQPYTARNPSGGTLETHALDQGRPGLSIEIRQDLIADERGCVEWADRLGGVLGRLLCRI